MKRFKAAISLFVCLSLILPLSGGIPLSVSAAALPFTDVSTSHPYYDSIKYVYENGIMSGTTTTTFDPAGSLTRGQIVTILYRISGSTAQIAPDFDDVQVGRYYYYPIGWAQSEGIAYGTSVDLFKPETPVTRQQAITFIYRYATQYEGMDHVLVSDELYEDAADHTSIGASAREAVNWAMNCGVVYVQPGGVFNPTMNATRSACANFLHAFLCLAYGDAKAFGWTQDGILNGNPEAISGAIYEGGYEASWWKDPLPKTVEFAYYNSNVIFTHSHGYDDAILRYNDDCYVVRYMNNRNRKGCVT